MEIVNGEEYLTAQEAADYLGVGRTTVDSYAKEGRITKYQKQAPRRILYKKSELEKLKGIIPKE